MTADPGRCGGEGTGWHLPRVPSSNPSMTLHRPGRWCDDRCIPVLVLDPVTARDTIAREMSAHVYWSTGANNGGCSCGWMPSEPGQALAEHPGHVARELLAALVSQERGEVPQP